jgi:hypothetical protein
VDGQLVSEFCPATFLDKSNPSCVPKDVEGNFPLFNGKLALVIMLTEKVTGRKGSYARIL